VGSRFKKIEVSSCSDFHCGPLGADVNPRAVALATTAARQNGMALSRIREMCNNNMICLTSGVGYVSHVFYPNVSPKTSTYSVAFSSVGAFLPSPVRLQDTHLRTPC
jgi:hypothetical protein